MASKTQILFVHGGMTFKTHEDYINWLKTREVSLESYTSWSGKHLSDGLEDCCDIIKPRMPLKDDAKYDDWKINFERYLDVMDDEIILIGTSLGGIFLTKYLSENKVDKKLISVYFVCAPFDGELSNEDLVGGFELQDDLSLIEKNCNNLTFLFSADDDIVPVSHADKYSKALPNAKVIILEGKNGHFCVEELPEIVVLIKKDLE